MNAVKVFGSVDDLSDGITIRNVEIIDGILTDTGETSEYECFQPDIYTLFEDTNQYTKGHVLSIEDVDTDTPFCCFIKENKVIAIVEAAGALLN